MVHVVNNSVVNSIIYINAALIVGNNYMIITNYYEIKIKYIVYVNRQPDFEPCNNWENLFHNSMLAKMQQYVVTCWRGKIIMLLL